MCSSAVDTDDTLYHVVVLKITSFILKKMGEIKEPRWIFTDEQMLKTPSRIQGMNESEEIVNRKLAAHFIHDMCGELKLTQLCLNTAVVYMHRFYMYRSFQDINKYSLATSALIAASKFLEERRSLDKFILYAHLLLRKADPSLPELNSKSEEYKLKVREILATEDLLLCTLGFELAVQHPHSFIVKMCQLIKASEDLAKSAYVMASVSQCISTMCLQHTPDIVACVCIHLASEWRGYKIQPLDDGKEWFFFLNPHITLKLLDDLKEKFKVSLEQKPGYFKKTLPSSQEKIRSVTIAQIQNLIANSENMKVEEISAKKFALVGTVLKAQIKATKIVYLLGDHTEPSIEVHVGIRECSENNALKIHGKDKNVRVVVNIRWIDGKYCLAAFNIQEVTVNNNTLPQNATNARHSSIDLKKQERDCSQGSSPLSSIENIAHPSKRRKPIS